MSALSDLLNSQPISARRAAELAEEQNVRLPYGTIAAYWSGKHGRPSNGTLTRLAQVLNIQLKDLQEAAWNTTAPLGAWVPPEESAFLDQRQRDSLDELIKSIVATRGAINGMEDATQPDAPSKADKNQEAGAGDRQRKAEDLSASDPGSGLDNGRPEDERQSDYDLVQRTRDPRVAPEIPDDEDWPADPEGPEGGA